MPVFIVFQTHLNGTPLVTGLSILKPLNLALAFQFDLTSKLFLTSVCRMLSVFFR